MKKERRRNGYCMYPGRDSTLLHCKGGVLVMPKVYDNGDGGFFTMGRRTSRRIQLSLNQTSRLSAFQALTAIYPPPKPNTNDSRYTTNDETEGENKGLYHFAYWQQNGHDWERATQYDLDRGATLSRDAFPSLHKYGLSKAGMIVPMFFQHMASVKQAIGSLFETIDPENYKRYRERYLEQDVKTTLRMFTATQHACFVGNACLVGLECELHRDVRDTEYGWIADVAFGDCAGGNLEVPQLGLEINLKPPGVVFMRPKLLWHGIGEVTMGLRYSMVSFTHAGMIDMQRMKEKGQERVDWSSTVLPSPHNDTEEEVEREEVGEEMVVDSNQDSHPIATPESLTSNKTRIKRNRREANGEETKEEAGGDSIKGAGSECGSGDKNVQQDQAGEKTDEEAEETQDEAAGIEEEMEGEEIAGVLAVYSTQDVSFNRCIIDNDIEQDMAGDGTG